LGLLKNHVTQLRALLRLLLAPHGLLRALLRLMHASLLSERLLGLALDALTVLPVALLRLLANLSKRLLLRLQLTALKAALEGSLYRLQLTVGDLHGNELGRLRIALHGLLLLTNAELGLLRLKLLLTETRLYPALLGLLLTENGMGKNLVRLKLLTLKLLGLELLPKLLPRRLLSLLGLELAL
jgi:hypothetical protein